MNDSDKLNQFNDMKRRVEELMAENAKALDDAPIDLNALTDAEMSGLRTTLAELDRIDSEFMSMFDRMAFVLRREPAEAPAPKKSTGPPAGERKKKSRKEPKACCGSKGPRHMVGCGEDSSRPAPAPERGGDNSDRRCDDCGRKNYTHRKGCSNAKDGGRMLNDAADRAVLGGPIEAAPVVPRADKPDGAWECQNCMSSYCQEEKPMVCADCDNADFRRV